MVLLRQRRPLAGGRDLLRGQGGRPRLVGPPRLGPHQRRARRRRHLPGAVRARGRGQAPARPRRVRRAREHDLRRRPRPARQPRHRRRQGRPAALARRRDDPRDRRPLRADPGRQDRPPARAGPEGQRRLRATRRRRQVDRGAGPARPDDADARPRCRSRRRRARRRRPARLGAHRHRRHRPARRDQRPGPGDARPEVRLRQRRRRPRRRSGAARGPDDRRARHAVTYRRLASPLHATRASAGALFCLVLAAGALLEHPLLLGAVATAVLVSAAGAGVLADLGRTAKYVVPLAIVFGLINPLVVREGLTVFARLGEIPPFGQVDLTVEALLYGVILGARIVVVALAFALFTACVDPDELLKLFRRVSFRSALTATLATRLVPVLARDGRRLELARRSRAVAPDGAGPSRADRVVILRAVASGALDRAVDVAATLEVRGYGATHRARPAHRPWSRHDLAFLAAALVLVLLFAGSALAGIGRFEAYPLLQAPVGPGELAVASAIVLVSVLPFLDRRGIEP
ncbi:hypothetical protein GKE82_04475 [Conexibacter sp. W3-3-2]|nr:hypothetical protein [Conexibacter sp. W3-3-2]